MITYLGCGAIKILDNGQFRAWRKCAWWVGDYPTFSAAKRALQIANSKGAEPRQRGLYISMHLTEAEHAARWAELDPFFAGHPDAQPVTMDDVRRTVLPNEQYYIVAGFPVINYILPKQKPVHNSSNMRYTNTL